MEEMAFSDHPKVEPTQLGLRVEYLEKLLDRASDIEVQARQTADRLYGPEPETDRNATSEDRLSGGLMAELDKRLEMLESDLRDCQHQISRLAET